MDKEKELKQVKLSEETEKIVREIDAASGNNLLSITADDLKDKTPEEIMRLYADTALFHYMTTLLADSHHVEMNEDAFKNLMTDKEKDIFRAGFGYGLSLQFSDNDSEEE